MKNNLSNSLKKFKGLGYGPVLRPQRDWFVLLALVALLLVVSVGWNLSLFDRVTNGENISGQVPPAAAHSANLDAVHTLFDTRKQEEARYVNDYRFVDPSSVGR